ncbi:hypothetical protein GCM10022222_51930 [Amycolatopsis ultiminotia]|uniref:ASCH domain-containing protein n=1 Tax=Amycolatopsis ultiminotia TaxID=543629 RepID=A0ABP6X5X4_9PSEU
MEATYKILARLCRKKVAERSWKEAYPGRVVSFYYCSREGRTYLESSSRAPRTSDLALRVHTDPTEANRRTAHFYWKGDLADPSVRWLVPWCSVDEAYPDRHERGEIDLRAVADAEWCRGCTGQEAP